MNVQGGYPRLAAVAVTVTLISVYLHSRVFTGREWWASAVLLAGAPGKAFHYLVVSPYHGESSATSRFVGASTGWLVDVAVYQWLLSFGGRLVERLWPRKGKGVRTEAAFGRTDSAVLLLTDLMPTREIVLVRRLVRVFCRERRYSVYEKL